MEALRPLSAGCAPAGVLSSSGSTKSWWSARGEVRRSASPVHHVTLQLSALPDAIELLLVAGVRRFDEVTAPFTERDISKFAALLSSPGWPVGLQHACRDD